MSMEQADALLYPYVTAPVRIALDLVDALAACPAVSKVVIFGSVAKGRHDGWSDIDALCAVEGEDGPWQAAAALRAAMPLRWHGAFSAAAPPSGRHWLLGESVFHSLDLTFGTSEAIERRVRDSESAYPVVADVRLERRGEASAGGADAAAIEALSDEYEFTHALYAAVKTMKQYLRAAGTWDALAERMHLLETAARGLTQRPRGSDPDDVMNETRTLYYALLQERARYGGDGEAHP